RRQALRNRRRHQRNPPDADWARAVPRICVTERQSAHPITEHDRNITIRELDMSTWAIVVSLWLLMFFAYRGVTVLILATFMAGLAVLLSGEAMYIMLTYIQVFMSELGGYLIKFFPLFILGALFGQLVADSGAAHTIAHSIMRRLGT